MFDFSSFIYGFGCGALIMVIIKRKQNKLLKQGVKERL
jgi:hypothetical protein